MFIVTHQLSLHSISFFVMFVQVITGKKSYQVRTLGVAGVNPY